MGPAIVKYFSIQSSTRDPRPETRNPRLGPGAEVEFGDPAPLRRARAAPAAMPYGSATTPLSSITSGSRSPSPPPKALAAPSGISGR